MNQSTRKSVFSITSGGRLRAGLAVLATFCFFIVPTLARASCGRFGEPGLKTTIRLPPATHAGIDPNSEFESPAIVGLWHVIYTNSADQSTFNDTFDTWHSDGTEFESAFLAPAGGDVCVGVWKRTGARGVKLHHIGWLFNPGTPTATATNTFTLDEEVAVAPDGKSYSGRFTFKVWNLDGTPTPVEVTGTMAATRITVD
jgi:hypothetical protein